MTEKSDAPQYPEIGSKAWRHSITPPRLGEIIDEANGGILWQSKYFPASLWGPADCYHADELSAWRRYLADLRAKIVVAENNIERLENAAKETHQ